MRQIYLALIVISLVQIVIVLGVVPPLGDVNCKSDSCDAIVCQKFNCTYGKVMNSPNVNCGCCKICMQYIAENGACGPNLSDKECGPGLFCTDLTATTSSTFRCQKMNTACFAAQDEYELKRKDGSLGMYETRPNCDANGDYVGRKCQPNGSCYCIDKDNNRIFGESPPNSALTDSDMNCRCSREYKQSLDQGLLRNQPFPHCLPNGNYDSLQCLSQACFCISMNYTVNSDVLPITSIKDLPCYKPEIHYVDYYRPCEKELNEALAFTTSYARQNITVLSPLQLPICTPDGYYHPIRETEDTFYCVTPFGEKMQEFEVSKGSDSSLSIDCKCARTRYWMATQNLAKPVCCKNGNYRPMQCKGSVCFCVNEDGDQMGIEVASAEVSKLDCGECAR